jgi:saccharopine dehydrogenase (NAD+, L-lysine forming)
MKKRRYIMKRKKYILIIGGCGAAGEVVTRLLAIHTENVIFIADINLEKAKMLAQQLRENITAIELDIFNAAQLRNICQMSDVIVNCAGPTARIRDTIGKIAIQEECDYIEIGGFDYTNEEFRSNITAYNNISYIISAGWIPGMSDYLAYFSDMRASEIFDRKENMLFFFGDRNTVSYNSLLDIVKYNQKDKAGSMNIAKSGKIIKSINPTKSFDLPFGLNKLRGFTRMTNEMQMFARNHSEYDQIKSYYISYGWKTWFTFMKIAFLKRSEEKCVRFLETAFQKEIDEKGKFGVAIVKISGFKDGKRMNLWTTIETTDNYFMTGAGCVATVMLLLKQKVKMGFGYMSESVDVSEYNATLNKLGVKISEKIE